MIELLAPAGNIEALKLAVYNSADAVYLGLEQFNARIKADNFSTHNILEWVEFCHLYGVKVYVALNTAIKNNEIDTLTDIIKICAEANVDAFIIADMSVAVLARKYAPRVQLHASTQFGVHNLEGVKFAERLGFTRVVLSRETPLEEIKKIKKYTELEVEYFVHGALCVSFSGGCLFSGMASGNSGNRGLCLQPCRKKYKNSITGEESYILSPKDLCLIGKLKELISVGVDSLKIEGRMKSPEYVGVVTKAYRNALNGNYNDRDERNLKIAFNRGGFSEGYLIGDSTNLICAESQGHIGVNIGTVSNCRSFNKHIFIIKFKTSIELLNGDGLKIFYNGKEIGGIEVNIYKVTDNVYEIYSTHNFPVGAEVNCTLSNILKTETNSIIKKIPICLNVVINKTILINIKTDNKNNSEITYKHNVALEIAEKKPTSIEEVAEQMTKLNNTPFSCKKIHIEYNEGMFIPKAVINSARREAIEMLRLQILRDYDKINNDFKVSKNENIKFKGDYRKYNYEVLSNNIEDIDNSNCNIILNYKDFNNIIIKNDIIKNNFYLKLPKIAFSDDIEIFHKILKQYDIGLYADNIYVLELALKYNKKVIGGFGLNLYNKIEVNELGLSVYCLSAELNKKEINEFDKGIIYAYGKIPIMTLNHCPIKNITGCDCNNCQYKPFYLQDKYGKYELRKSKINRCQFTLYNTACHNLISKIDNTDYALYIDLTLENNPDSILKLLKDGLMGEGDNFTLGHYNRGVK